jgi:hypothetical protein
MGFPTIVPASALGAAGAPPPSDRITLGCIGVGRQGTGDMRGYLQRDDTRVAAVNKIDSPVKYKQHLTRPTGFSRASHRSDIMTPARLE